MLRRGIVLRTRDLAKDVKASTEEESRWGAFVEGIDGDQRSEETLEKRVRAHEDFGSIGWGVLEVSRERGGLIDGL